MGSISNVNPTQRAFADVRRDDLAGWIGERAAHDGLTAREIADVSGIYSGHGAADRCFDDLKVLARLGIVYRDASRPARWWLAR